MVTRYDIRVKAYPMLAQNSKCTTVTDNRVASEFYRENQKNAKIEFSPTQTSDRNPNFSS